VRKAIVEPVLFARRILGVELWNEKSEIFIQFNNRKTAIKRAMLARPLLWR
jgi:hypothetical protein